MPFNNTPNQMGCPCSHGSSTPIEYTYPDGCIVSAKGRALASGDNTIIVNL